MGAGRLGRFGDQAGGVVGGGGQHRVLAARGTSRRAALGDVGRDLGHRGAGLQAIELRLGAVDDGDRIVARTHQQLRDHRADLACAHDGYLMHVYIPRLVAGIFAERRQKVGRNARFYAIFRRLCRDRNGEVAWIPSTSG